MRFAGPPQLVYLPQELSDIGAIYVSDLRLAYERLSDAAKEGNGNAAAAIANMFLNGSIQCVNRETEMEMWIARAIECGSDYGNWVWGWSLMERCRTNESIDCLISAYKGGFAPAALDLGVVYQMGWGVRCNPLIARKYFLAAKELGHVAASWSIRNLEVSGDFGLLRAVFSSAVRPFSRFRWKLAVLFGSKFTPATLHYPFPERINLARKS